MVDYNHVECSSACITALTAFRARYPDHRAEEVAKSLRRGVKYLKRCGVRASPLPQRAASRVLCLCPLIPAFACPGGRAAVGTSLGSEQGQCVCVSVSLCGRQGLPRMTPCFAALFCSTLPCAALTCATPP